MSHNQNKFGKIFIDPLYTQGKFYDKSSGEQDALYKVDQLAKLLKRNGNISLERILRVADVGCGTGKTTFLLQKMLEDLTDILPVVDGYDIHPYLKSYDSNIPSVRFYTGDFCVLADGLYDLVVLFDVIEHIPDPVTFIKEISTHARLMAFHIPLDNSILSMTRNLPRKNLNHPGHLVILDLPAALNLLTFSGLRILDFSYSPIFQSPSGQLTLAQKLLYPMRVILFKLSPYLTQKLFGGVSVTVLAWTSQGISELNSA